MSMNGWFRSVSEKTIHLLDDDPSLGEVLVHYDAESPLPAFVPDPAMLANFSADFRASIEASAARQAELMQTASARLASLGIGSADLGRPGSIHKAWHGVHYLLAGLDYTPQEPPANCVLGGREVGPDLGYGPARCFDAAQTAAIARTLAELDIASVQARFDPTAMEAAQIYPGGWDQPDSLEWLTQALAQLHPLYREAQTQGHGMLLAIR